MECEKDVSIPFHHQPNMNTTPPCITVSAPGKVLIAGGYLVLEQPNVGIVLAANGCSFHSTVMATSVEGENFNVNFNSNSNPGFWLLLRVHSPQFRTVFEYSVHVTNDGVSISPNGDASNPFIERTLAIALRYIHEAGALNGVYKDMLVEGKVLSVKLRADNDFYSQVRHLKQKNLELTPGNMARLDPFLPCPVDESTGELIVNKTGMGSSAALVTSLVGSLLRYFGLVKLPSTSTNNDNDDNLTYGKDVAMVHNLSQICHSVAQGKIGSGFDVSSACYGSHAYTRFNPDIISDCMNEELGMNNVLYHIVNDNCKWDNTVRVLNLIEGIELLMADVCGGSESPSMARKIMKWKRERIASSNEVDLWEKLKQCNNDIFSLMQTIVTCASDNISSNLPVELSQKDIDEWKKCPPFGSILYELRQTLSQNRSLMKQMGDAAGVPVVPDTQSHIIEETEKIKGVIACGVPGAGGYDALYVIYLRGEITDEGRSDIVRDEVASLWKSMSEDNGFQVCPLSLRSSGSMWGGLKESYGLPW